MFNETSTSGLPARNLGALFRPLPALVIIALLAGFPPSALATGVAALRTVLVRGSTVYSSPQFFAAYRDELGEPITRETARTISAAIARHYQDDGFARPELRVDQALAPQGILRFDVFEPRITRVTFGGGAERYRDEILRIAGAVRKSVPLSRDAIPRALAAMRQLPGLTVTATTRRDGTAPNSHELVLIAEFAPVAGIARMNNRGTDQIGRAFVLGHIGANDLLGWSEKLGLVFAAATDVSEYLSGGLFLDAPLGAGGSRGFAMVFRSESDPRESPEDLEATYVRERLSLRLTRPLRLAADPGIHVSGAFEAEDLTVDLDGIGIRDDRLRVVEAGARLQWRAGAATQLSSSLELRKGLDLLGAGLSADDIENDQRRGDFLVTQLQATSLTRMSDAWSIRFDAFAQQTAYVLPDSERFKIGGERLGRGFELAEIAGDQGLGAKMTLRRDLPALGGALGRTSIYGLYDLGAAWKQDAGGRESAATTGVGLALQGARLSGYVEVVKPLTHADVEGKRSAALFAELSFRF